MLTALRWRRGAVIAAITLGLGISAFSPHPAHAANATVKLVVQKGGDRTGPEAVDGLAGSVFDFFAGTSGNPPAANATPDATCTTVANGQCSVNVPGHQGYWIRERTAPSGFSIATTLDTGTDTITKPTAYNPLFTGKLPNSGTETFPKPGTGNHDLTARGDFWADIRDNPPLPDECGLNIALLIDTSGSIKPSLPMVKGAANGFVDALTGTPSRIALYRFAADATQLLGSTAVPDATSAHTVKAAINSLTAGGATNWDAGLFQIAAASTTYDAVIMLTDGNPTVYGPAGTGPGNRARFREVENGIFSANAVKAKGTKIVAVGVGTGVSGAKENLQAISGPVAGTDYVQTDYAQLAAVFRALALKTCSGTISVIKKVIPPGGTPAQGVPTGGWKFSTSTTGVTPATGETADDSGALSFTAPLNGADSKAVTLTETQKTGFTLVQINNQNAACTSDGKPVTVTPNGALGFTVDARGDAIVTCTVYNVAPTPPQPAKLTLRKTVVNTHGGTATSTDWILHATPVRRDSTAHAIVGRDGEPSVTDATAVPDVRYALTETDGPADYEQVGVPTCLLTGTTTPVDVSSGTVTPGSGEDITCTFVNHDEMATAIPTPSESTTPPLPVTGSVFAPVAGAGVMIFLSGVGLLFVARRKRTWTED